MVSGGGSVCAETLEVETSLLFWRNVGVSVTVSAKLLSLRIIGVGENNDGIIVFLGNGAVVEGINDESDEEGQLGFITTLVGNKVDGAPVVSDDSNVTALVGN